MSLDAAIKTFVKTHGKSPWVIALSGGLDSTVLAHALAPYAKTQDIKLLHIHHGLQVDADAWVSHCQSFAQNLHLSLDVIHVDASKKPGESPEESARRARYEALIGQLEPNSLLLTAHHARDQAETFLLNLVRGAGLLGLAAMPYLREFSGFRHCRPLLNVPYAELLDYAETHQLSWINDSSNEDLQYSRNFMRHIILPKLRERWADIDRQIGRSCRILQENQQLVSELAMNDAEIIIHDGIVAIDKLKIYPAHRQKNLLRYWLQTFERPLPGEKAFVEFLRMLDEGSTLHDLVLQWSSEAFRAYDGKLYISRAKLPSLESLVLPFDFRPDLKQADIFTLYTAANKDKGLRLPNSNEHVTIRFRHGGERVRPLGRARSQSLKKLMQEYRVPVWRRNLWPLIFYDERLAAVPGLFVNQDFAEEKGYAFELDWYV